MKILSSKNKEKVAVYIDGNNFYKYLKDKEVNLLKGTKFNFSKFIDFLKRIEYVGFSHAPSLGMQKHSDFSILLRPDDIDKFKEEKLL